MTLPASRTKRPSGGRSWRRGGTRKLQSRIRSPRSRGSRLTSKRKRPVSMVQSRVTVGEPGGVSPRRIPIPATDYPPGADATRLALVKLSHTNFYSRTKPAGEAIPLFSFLTSRANSGGCISRDARHAVEVGIAAGKVGQTVLLHDGNDQRVVTQQAGLLADFGALKDQRGGNGQDPKLTLEDFFNGGAEMRQL